VLGPDAGLHAEQVGELAGGPTGAGLEVADVGQRCAPSPTGTERVPVVVDRHVEVVGVAGRHDHVITPRRQLAAGVGGPPTHHVAVAGDDTARLGGLLPGTHAPSVTLADQCNQLSMEGGLDAGRGRRSLGGAEPVDDRRPVPGAIGHLVAADVDRR
jgi:hypothetical protein